MTKSVVLIDYGVGNLLSVRWALEAVGAKVIQTADRKQIASADRIVLPGVGAFGHCMQELHRYKLVNVLQEYSQSGYPMLGICVGMQMLMESSEEFGFTKGLELIPGEVKKIPNSSRDGERQKIPYIGWNPIFSSVENGYLATPLECISQGAHFYFIHSYAVETKNSENTLAKTYYGGRSVVAAIQSGNTFGLQFHPEKSAEEGLSIMRQFLNLERL